MKNLLRRYKEVNDELLDYTTEFYDGNLFDIEGYHYEDGNYKADLEARVLALEMMLNAYKALDKAPIVFA